MSFNFGMDRKKIALHMYGSYSKFSNPFRPQSITLAGTIVTSASFMEIPDLVSPETTLNLKFLLQE
jgi:hypothetical protein